MDKDKLLERFQKAINDATSDLVVKQDKLGVALYQNTFGDLTWFQNVDSFEQVPETLTYEYSTDAFNQSVPQELILETEEVDGWVRTINGDEVVYRRVIIETRLSSDDYRTEEIVKNKYSNGSFISYTFSGSVVNIKNPISNEVSERVEKADNYAKYKVLGEGSSSVETEKEEYTNSNSPVNSGMGGQGGLVAMYTNSIYSLKEDIYRNGNNYNDVLEDTYVPKKTEPKEHIDVEPQGDHIFPVELVGNTTNKLIDYNNQLANFMDDIDYYEHKIRLAVKKGPGKINLTFIGKAVQKFCKRINYWLAVLRYQLIKALHGAIEGFEEAIKPITELIGVVKGLLSINIDTIVTGVIEFATVLLEIIFGPYMKYIQFGIDTVTYVPPLVQEASDLVDGVTTGTEKVMSIAESIQKEVDRVTNTDYLDPEVAKRLIDKYTDMGDTSIELKFEPITLGDILGEPPEKPKWEDFK